MGMHGEADTLGRDPHLDLVLGPHDPFASAKAMLDEQMLWG